MNFSSDCVHLSVDKVQKIHNASIRRFGGNPELRSRELLESAVAAPQAIFEGKSFFADRVEIAAAYLYYICSNHPFIDGSKRTALGVCLVFLKLNGMSPAPDSRDWERLTVDIAASRINRETATARLRGMVEDV